MAGRGALAISGLLTALTVILATVPENGSVAGAPGLSARKEWSSEWYTHGLQYNLSDTDGDGTSELLVWVSSSDDGPKGVARLFVYDPPGHKLAFSAIFLGDIRPDVRDLDGDGIPELVVVSMGAQHNITIFSGRTYAVKWKSPDFSDSSLYYQVSDIDSDGELELVWYGMYDTGSAPPAETATRMHAYGASSYKEKLNLSGIDGWTDGFWLCDLDADAAKECVLVTHVWRGNCLAGTRLRIVDCASGRMQWETADDPAVDRFSQPQFADINNDSRIEVLAAVRVTDPVNGSAASLRIYSGENGSLVRSFNAGQNIQDFEAVDVDRDRCREILLTSCTEENPWSPTCTITLEVVDPMEDKVLWSLGPIPGTGQGGTSLDGHDLNGDGVPEIIVTNYTWGKTGLCSRASYTVLDGSDLSIKWTSPQFGGKTENLVAVDQDRDGVLEILVPDTAVGADGRPTDRLHIFSTDDFREEWASGEFGGGIVSAECRQIRGNGTPEILLTNLDVKNGTDDHTWQKILLDGGTRSTIWSSPRRPGIEFDASNLVDGPGKELFVVGNTWKLGDWRSEMWLYDGSSFGLIWTSGRLADYYSMIATGDIDNDGYGEALLMVERDNGEPPSEWRLAIYEFSAPLGPGSGAAGEEQRFPVVSENTARPGTGGGAAPVVLAAAAITVASASTGAVALAISRRKRHAAPEPASPVVAGLELAELQPGQEVEIRR